MTAQTADRTRAQFDTIRAAAMRVQERRESYRIAMYEKYRKSDPPRSWKTKTEVDRLDAILRAETKIIDRMIAFLDANSPRTGWSHAVPACWAIYELSYEDAVTSGQMATIPPAPFGQRTSDVERFVAALPETTERI